MVTALDHKDSYSVVVSSNAKTHSNKLLKYLRCGNIARPPKNYEDETVQKVAMTADDNVRAVMWHLPECDKFLIGRVELVAKFKRGPKQRLVNWKHPRPVITVETSCPDLAAANTVWDAEIRGYGLPCTVLDGARAVDALDEHIVRKSGCLFYGPMTRFSMATLDDDNHLSWSEQASSPSKADG